MMQTLLLKTVREELRQKSMNKIIDVQDINSAKKNRQASQKLSLRQLYVPKVF